MNIRLTILLHYYYMYVYVCIPRKPNIVFEGFIIAESTCVFNGVTFLFFVFTMKILFASLTTKHRSDSIVMLVNLIDC